jgi:hypothetical protein
MIESVIAQKRSSSPQNGMPRRGGYMWALRSKFVIVIMALAVVVVIAVVAMLTGVFFRVS